MTLALHASSDNVSSVTHGYAVVPLATLSEVWVQFDLLIPAASFAAWPGFSDSLFAAGHTTVFDDIDDLFVTDVPPWKFEDDSPAPDWGAPAADTWITVGFHFNGGNVDWQIDGVAWGAGPQPGGGPTDIDQVAFGLNAVGSTGATIGIWVDNIAVGTGGFGSSDIFATDFETGTLDSIFGPTNHFGSGSYLSIGTPPGPTPPGSTVLVQEPPWRYVVADIIFNVSGPASFSTLTFLDQRAIGRQISYYLRQPGTATGRVAADDPEINLVHIDGEPLLAEGVRALICLRREGGTPPWRARHCGIIKQANRIVQDDVAYVNFTSFEPRDLLYKRPVRTADGLLLGVEGRTFASTRGDAILLELLSLTEAVDGPTFIDTTTGTIEATDPISITFQQGSSVGEALDQLEQTGTIDVLLPAVYDPVGSPGVLAQLNVYVQAGSTQYAAIMAWDMPGRTLVGIDWLEDGGQRENNVELYTADGQPTAVQTSGASVSKYGSYWGQQNYPEQVQVQAVEAQAAIRLLTHEDHYDTITIHPSPQRADPPFTGYFVADWLPTYASKRLGKALAGLFRVYEMQLDLPDDTGETPHLVVSAVLPPG